MPINDLSIQNLPADIKRVPITIPASSSDAAALSALLAAGDGTNKLSTVELSRLLQVKLAGAGASFEVGDSVALVEADTAIQTYATTATYNEPQLAEAAASEFLRAAADATVAVVAVCYLAREPVLVE